MPILPTLTVEKAPISELIPYAKNAKEHPAWQIEQIVASIDQFGMNDPIGVWTTPTGKLEIIEGHGRLMACKKLGMAEVPVIRLDHLDADARRAYILAHNQLTMNTGFDIDALNEELKALFMFDMANFGFEMPQELESLEGIEEDEVPITAPSRCEAGDIWQLGQHRLICGDSRNPDTVSALMDGHVADLLLTDPPYGVDYASKNEFLNKADKGNRIQVDIENDAYADERAFSVFLSDAFEAAAKHLKAGGAFYIWYAQMKTKPFVQALEHAGLDIRQYLVWVKNNFALGMNDYQWKHEPCFYGWKPGAGHYFAPTRSEVTTFDGSKPVEKMTKEELVAAIKALTADMEYTALYYDKPLRSDLHPTMKPVQLFAHLMRNSSRKDEIVLDIFAGSGTTMVAAQQLGRKAYMVEYDPHYCDVIIERYEQLTGETAEKIA